LRAPATTAGSSCVCLRRNSGRRPQFETQEPGSQTRRTWFRIAKEPGLVFDLVLEFLGGHERFALAEDAGVAE
jgi:hypothetical protein